MYPAIILSNLFSLRRFPQINKEDLQPEIQKTASEIVEAEQEFKLLQSDFVRMIIGFALVIASYAILHFITREIFSDFSNIMNVSVVLLMQKGLDILFSIVAIVMFLLMGIIYMKVWAYALSQSENRIYLSHLQNQL
ncbi:MAG: hypothetical protein JWM20_391 [Patescibacteria group bacterium]|nr:hypothetical protein [Patescibacteria group bacterium]